MIRLSYNREYKGITSIEDIPLTSKHPLFQGSIMDSMLKYGGSFIAFSVIEEAINGLKKIKLKIKNGECGCLTKGEKSFLEALESDWKQIQLKDKE